MTAYQNCKVDAAVQTMNGGDGYVSTPEQDCIAFRSKDASMIPTKCRRARACLVGVRLGSDRLWACRRCCGVSAACSD